MEESTALVACVVAIVLGFVLVLAVHIIEGSERLADCTKHGGSYVAVSDHTDLFECRMSDG